ncbi:MAG: hypothetical protein LBT03_00215 [Holosporales bacterium]|jgi:type VI secretion system protein ImpL|nr:hypothetical protein [Holosporales bacterium]
MALLTQWIDTLTQGGISLPLLIGIILAIAFISMLLVTVFTLVSLKRAEMKSRRTINIPPSAMKDSAVKDKEEKDGSESDPDAPSPWPIGEWLNKYLIEKGYIRANSIVKSFFKALDFLKKSLGTGYKYKLPWYMILGTEQSGKSSLLSGFTNKEIYDDEEDSPCTWWFLKNGIVLDVNGAVFLPKDGFNSDDKSWNILLNMLSRYRAERPLNGIILTIPADELYGRNKLSPEDITKRAQYMAKKLNFAQSYLGMKLPVYVVVTKTDVVPGFQSFCSEIPVRNRNNMLGWSSPYSIDVIYTPRLLDEGFATLENELNEIRMEIFAENFTTTTRDGIFVFPSELLTIKPLLSIYIDAIFKSASIEERFYFRGFYFTGDSKMVPLLQFNDQQGNNTMAIIGTPDADVNEAGEVSACLGSEQFAPKKIFFFEDLLMRKVFAESGVATPMISKIHQSNKSIFIAKVSTAAFVLIGSYGLFNAYDQLQGNKDLLYPSLFKLSTLIKNASDLTYKNLERDGNEILADCTNYLLSMMQQLNNARLSSLFVPASWFSSINRDLTETLRASYQRVVVRTIYMNLMLKAKELLNMNPDGKSSSIAQVLNPNNSAEYKQLKEYVFGLIELEKNIKKFDSLRTSGDPKDLNDLIDYTFHGSLPQEFLDRYQEFRKILMNTPFPPINLTPYKQTAYNVLISIFQNYLNAVFTNKSTTSVMAFLTRFVEQLTRQNIKETPDCSNVVKFSKDLTCVCKELGEEGNTWLDKDVFEADSEYDSFLDGVEALFGRDVSQKLFDVTVVNFGYLKAKLMEFNNFLKSDITRQNANKMEDNEKESCSSGIYKMERCLAVLCSEPFMEKPGNYQLITNIPNGKMIFWDDELVQYAYETGRRFEQFAATIIKDFPRVMQEGIILLAKSNMSSVIVSTIAKSQSLVDAPSGITSEITSEEILQKQVAELKEVAPRLVKLLSILRDDKLGFVFGNLRSVLNKIGFTMLNHIDKLLENQKPYMPSNLTFSFWNGDSGAGLDAFSVADMEELFLFIQLQRSMTMRLALDFADSIVEFLNAEVVFDKNYGDQAQLAKWTRVVQSAKGVQKKDPTSSITAIERFIMRQLNEYTIDNITSKIEQKDLVGESGDYFLNIIKSIKKGIMSRAEILIRKRNIERYNSLRDYYTKHLETKFPFSNYDKTQRVATDADIEAVREFFKMYDEYGGTPERVLDQIYQLEGDAKELYEFLKRVHNFRQFFEDFFSNQYEAIKVNLEANFTISKREESNADYLVDRVFKPNDDSSIEPISQDKSGVWYFGRPIEIDLRWATGDNQADKPVYDPNDPDLIIEENIAKFQCVGNWAVIRFLQKYKSDSANASKLVPDQVLLRFDVPLSSGKISKIFVGITPSIPKKPGDPSVTSLKVPTPVGKAPEMPSSVISVANEAVLVSKIRRNQNITEPEIEQEPKPEESPEIHLVSNDKAKKTRTNTKPKKKQEPKKREPDVRSTSEKKEIQDVLKSAESPTTDEIDQVVEISEEPIT